MSVSVNNNLNPQRPSPSIFDSHPTSPSSTVYNQSTLSNNQRASSFFHETNHEPILSNSSVLGDQNNIPKQPPAYDPLSFRQNQDPSISYQFQSNPGPQIIVKEDLAILKNCLNSYNLPGFNPWQIDTHPIHNELYKLCVPLLQRCEHLPLENRVPFLNNAIAEIVLGCVCSNSLDNLDYLSIMPKFELLEIALRSHLFQGLLSQEQHAIKKFYDFNLYFPDNLAQRETALHLFVTKDHFYYSPNLNLYSILAQELLQPTLSSYIHNTVVADSTLDSALHKQDELIASQLKTLHLSQPSQCSLAFEADLRDGIARKVMTKLAAQYKREFQATGNFSREQLCKDTAKLFNFITANGKLTSLLNPMAQLIFETFELPNSPAPFVSVRAKIIQEQNAPIAQPAPAKKIQAKLFSLVSSPLRFPKTTAQQRQNEKNALAAKQQATIDWVEQEWNKLMQPITANNAVLLSPSAPPIDSLPNHPERNPQENLSPELLTDWVELDPPLILNDAQLSVPPITNQLPTIEPVTPISIDATPIITPEPPQEVPTTVVIAPLRKEPAPIETPKFSANDPNIPVISYVDIAFEELLKRGGDAEKWDALPQIVKKDVLRHVYYYRNVKGKAEELALRIFKNDGLAIQNQVNTLNKRHIPTPVNGLPESFIAAGQALIDFYHSDKILGQYHNFINRFRELPKEPRFYQYVYEMAKAANVHIESWDHQFAQYNWDQPGIIHLSVQALERCLHTTP